MRWPFFEMWRVMCFCPLKLDLWLESQHLYSAFISVPVEGIHILAKTIKTVQNASSKNQFPDFFPKKQPLLPTSWVFFPESKSAHVCMCEHIISTFLF